MKVLKKEIRFPDEEYYDFHLRMLSLFSEVKLTNKEREFVAALLYLSDKHNIKTVTPELKELLKSHLKIDRIKLYNYFHVLKNKGYRIYGNDGLLTDLLKMDKDIQGYQIKLIRGENKEH